MFTSEAHPEGERSAVAPDCGRLPEKICGMCGAALTGNQQTACSDRCRANLSRRARAEKEAERDQQVRELLERALACLAGGVRTPEMPGQR